MNLEEMLGLAQKESKETEVRKKLISRDFDKIKNELVAKFKDYVAYLRLSGMEQDDSTYRGIQSDDFARRGLDLLAMHKLLHSEITVLNIYPAISELLLKYTDEYLFIGSNEKEFVIVSNFKSIALILGCLR